MYKIMHREPLCRSFLDPKAASRADRSRLLRFLKNDALLSSTGFGSAGLIPVCGCYSDRARVGFRVEFAVTRRT